MPRSAAPSSDFDELFRDLPASYAEVARALRDTIRSEAPHLVGAVRWNNPFWKGKKDGLCLQCYPDHMNLGFLRGAELSGSNPEIVGSGKAMRHLPVGTTQEARSPKVRRLIRTAVRLDAGD